jgi:hypothetical protein
VIHGGNEGVDRSDYSSLLGTNTQEHEVLEDEYTMKIFSEKRKLNVGKISVILLALFSMADFILNLVDAQMDSLVAPDHYDALSADVIRPAFRYHSSSSERKPRLGLGSAAISSVTEALSPILPFTGGLDLRREDYWTNGWFGSVSSVIEQVRDAFSGSSETPSGTSFLTTPRGGGRVPTSTKSKNKKSQSKHTLAVSSSEPFVPLKDIAQLTLKEVSLSFRHAIESTRYDFHGAKFMSGAVPRVKKVFEQVSAVAATSRGKDIKAPVTGMSTESGDIDALHFCAAMRIFAEWRILRQVPDGYKGYAVGMSLGQKDVVQNVAKIEQAAHNWIDYRAELLSTMDSESEKSSDLYSPTLRDLLQYEIDMDVHDNSKLPRLKDKTAAMGLLWVRRQLHYQTALFANVIRVPDRFETARAAISAGYNEVYDRYHGWAVQKIFNYSFQAAPDAIEVYKVMNPRRLEEVTEAARVKAMKAGADNSFHASAFDEEEGNPVEKLGKHIGKEWDKFAGSVVQLFGHTARPKMERVRGGADVQEGPCQSEMENYITQAMEKDAHEHISAYLEVAFPLLEDLAKLFDEFNMDDPTKV